jgi:hypothetical protein
MNNKPDFCKNCEAKLNGNFCHLCGEQKLNKNTRSLAFISEAFVSEITSLDSKIFMTLKNFFFKPGKQVHDFHLGRRKKYFSLISLFFIFNLIYFLSSPMTDFNLSLVEQLHQPYQALIQPEVEKIAKFKSPEFKTVQLKYDAMSDTIAKSVIIISVPLFALLLPLINFQKNYYLQDHIMFALNIYAFILIWPILCKYFFNFIFWIIPASSMLREQYLTILLIGVMSFIWCSQKNAYSCSKLEATIKLIPLMALLFISHMMYRFLQFWLTWWQIN